MLGSAESQQDASLSVAATSQSLRHECSRWTSYLASDSPGIGPPYINFFFTHYLQH